MKKGILIHPEELSSKWIDRMVVGGVDVLGIHPVGGKHAAESLVDLLEQLKKPTFRDLLDDAAEKGLEIEYEIHTASYLMPRGLFDSHPEYFRMDEDENRTPQGNFCVSNEEGMGLVAARAAELAQSLYRSRPVYYFWMDDTRGKTCHCPLCRELSPSEQQLKVVNYMIREIRKSIPDAQMAHIAYLDCLTVPQKVKPEPGVFLEFAPIEKARPNPNLELAAEEMRMAEVLLSYFGKENAKVLEYWLDNSLFSDWKKPPKPFSADPAAVKADVEHYLAMGFDNIATFGCYLGQDYEELYGDPDISAFTNL